MNTFDLPNIPHPPNKLNTSNTNKDKPFQRWRKITTAQEDEKPSGHEEFTNSGGVGEAPV